MSTLGRGRRASITLSSGGYTRTVQGWADELSKSILNSDEREKAASKIMRGIRERLYQRNKGKALTDSQVIYGISYIAPDSRPMSVGLPILIENWINDELTDLLPAITRRVALKAAEYVQDNLVVAHQKHNDMSVHDVAAVSTLVTEKITTGNFPVTTSALEGNTVEAAYDASVKYLDDIREGNAVTPTGETMAELMIAYWMSDIPFDPAYAYESAKHEIEAFLEGQRQRELQSAPTPELTPADSLTEYSMKANSLMPTRFLFLLMQKHPPLYPLPTDDPGPLSQDEINEYYAKPWVDAFVNDIMHTEQEVYDRMLKTRQEFLYLLYCPDAVSDITIWRSNGVIRFMYSILYDIGYRCLLGVTDHRTFNRAMEIYFIGKLLAHKRAFLDEAITLQMLDRLQELDYSPFDAAIAAVCLKVFPTRSSIERGSDAVQQVIRLLEQFLLKYKDAAEVELWKSKAIAFWSGEFEQNIDSLPVDLDEGEYTLIRDTYQLMANYGRNVAAWPYELEKLPDREWLPCELYFDATKRRDYSIYEGSPLIENGTHSYLEG